MFPCIDFVEKSRRGDGYVLVEKGCRAAFVVWFWANMDMWEFLELAPYALELFWEHRRLAWKGRGERLWEV